MKIALFTDADVFAGTERHMLDLAEGIRQAGARATILCPNPSPLSERAARLGIPIIGIEKRGLADTAAIGTVRRLLRSGAMDVVHSHNGRTALLAATARTLAGRGRLVATQHFLEPGHLRCQRPEAALKRRMHRWVDGRTDSFIAISQAVRNAMIERGDAPVERISVVLNGLSVPPAAALEPEQANVRADLGVADDAPLVVCVARLQAEKDIATLVDAMAQVVLEFPRARCIVAGQGTEREALEARIRNAGIADSMNLIGFTSNALALIQAGDVFVLPSRAEPFGLVLLEAMAMGRAVIAARAGGPPEIVEEGKTGALFPPGDAAALAKLIGYLIAKPAQREAMGSAGRDRQGKLFSVERMAEQTVEIYKATLAGTILPQF